MRVDTLITNGRVFNAYFKKFIEADVAILDGKILYVGKQDTNLLQPQKIVDATDKYIMPGLIDIHMHIESSMATPYTFSNEIIKRGITTIVSEPHEIANVMGVEGVEEMLKASENCEVDVFIGIPCCVPSTSEKLETTGGVLGLEEIDYLMRHKNVACLGEFMNFKELISKEDSKSHRILKLVREQFPQYPIEGHCPKLSGLDLAKFVYHGIDSDHTQQTIDGMLERIQNGMFIQIQDKSLNPELIDVLNSMDLFEHVALTTDDVIASKLMGSGHLDYLFKKAVSLGITPENAAYITTYTPARRMRFYDRGVVAPGKLADLIIIDDLTEFTVERTFKNGKLVFSRSEACDQVYEIPKFPEHFYTSVHLTSISEDQLLLKTPHVKDGHVACRVMEINDGTTYTTPLEKKVRVQNHRILWEETDNLLVAVFERHGKSKNITLGLATGNTIKRGAVASTYVHDHHNLLVIGKNLKDMVIAANKVIESQGGICTVENGQILAKLNLTIAGILSDKPMDMIGKELQKVVESLNCLGYDHYCPVMSLATNGLAVSPALKITDKGLVDVLQSTIVSLII